MAPPRVESKRGLGEEMLHGSESAARNVSNPEICVMVVSARSDNLPVPINSRPREIADAHVEAGFDYEALPPNVASVLLERRNEIRAGVKKTTEAVIAIGRNLIDAKKMLGHGRFIEWVEIECGFCTRTAQNYMAITRVSSKYAFVSHLPVGTVLRLARCRGRRELLQKISTSLGPDRRLTDEQFYDLHQKFRRMQQLKPKGVSRRNRRSMLKPIERVSARFAGGQHTKTEWAKMNVNGLKRFGGMHALLLFRDIVESDTVIETLSLVRAEIRRWEFESGLKDLQGSAAHE
jgi:hypothetical protein